MIRHFCSFVLGLFFPHRCIFCGHFLSSGEWICSECEKDPQIHPKTIRKWLNRRSTGNPILCMVPYRYDGKVRESIHALKFYRRKEIAVFYGNQIADLLKQILSGDFAEVVACVPMSRKKERRRGYNQAELLAESVSRKLNLPYERLLKKVRENQNQHDLNREERKRNVEGVYAACCQERIKGRKILLIDDVVTTGSTLEECAQVLFEAGAKDVICAAAACTLHKDRKTG